ncbi:MAG: sulfate adenylyltransferase [Actinomycetota bacterium]|nr:sulfate adenylyltransferase [Actinomycetota bacterium]
MARLGADLALSPLRPFRTPPLRAHRSGPAEAGGGEGVLTVAVPGLPGADDVTAAIAEASARGLRLTWLVLVGHRRGPLSPEGAWRAAAGLARLAGQEGVDARVVPVAVPRLVVRSDPEDSDPLAREVTRRYAFGGPWLVLPDVRPGCPTRPIAAPAATELARAVRPAARRGVTVFFTGLSGSGKSTLAQGLAARLAEDGRRSVTLLDGDEVRRLLSHGLGFGEADRNLNIRRIGFVATEVTRHGGVAICAPIAPFAAARRDVRTAVEQVGDLVLVHVATPLAECERRDRKGLYARARRGEIPWFTGISSPYEEPSDADLVLDTTDRSAAECVEAVWALLERRGYLGTDERPEGPR